MGETNDPPMREVKPIISVHIPKTAGTSLATEIKQGSFGTYLLDYLDHPSNTRLGARLRRVLNYVKTRQAGRNPLLKYNIVHGHFLVRKYAFLFPQADFITFMREPVSRVISAYYYLKYEASKNPVTMRNNPRIALIAQNQLDLIEFARLDVMKYIYSRFTDGLALDQFRLIGITERFVESIRLLNGMYSVNVAIRHERHTDYSKQEHEYASRLKELHEINRENQRIYVEALRLFEQHLARL